MSSRPQGPFTFELTGDRGAALVTTHDTRREDCVDGPLLENHIKNNYQSWTRFAREKAQLPRDAQLIIVSGFDVTKDFSMVSFLQEPGDTLFGASGVAITARERMFLSSYSNFRGGWRYGREPYFNDGNSDRINQCVFIRYFTMRYRLFFSEVARFLRARFGSAGNRGGGAQGPVPQIDDKSTTDNEGCSGGVFGSTTGGVGPGEATTAQTTSYVWSLPRPSVSACKLPLGKGPRRLGCDCGLRISGNSFSIQPSC